VRASVIVPAYNAELTIRKCLEALKKQTIPLSDYEIIVVDDGSTDRTGETAASTENIKIVRQTNAGPAAARNNGARQAQSKIIVFTDSDCFPETDWLEKMLIPFGQDTQIAAVKGAYLTRQRELAARFVQLEYEEKYDRLKKSAYIDFVDTYSAAFIKKTFLEFGGYDTEFKVACAEDVELSFRMANAGHKMVFNPDALVYHIHPASWIQYFNKKYKFAYWRMLAVRKNPNKAVNDSHTPQLMKLQLLLAPIILLSLPLIALPGGYIFPLLATVIFGISTAAFIVKAFPKDPVVAIISPLILGGRAFYQFWGVFCGLMAVLKARR
jgi:glycosyltransferase involved in cell wall biosynthesis